MQFTVNLWPASYSMRRQYGS